MVRVTRVVFMGTPEFALPSLAALLAACTVVGVVTQPDRPAGRGRQVVSPPVKAVAEAAGVPVIQPQRLREPEAMAQLQAWAPDLIVVTAFGQILKPAVLDLPPRAASMSMPRCSRAIAAPRPLPPPSSPATPTPASL
jgi:methionyl-tRNA formyltransferase